MITQKKDNGKNNTKSTIFYTILIPFGIIWPIGQKIRSYGTDVVPID